MSDVSAVAVGPDGERTGAVADALAATRTRVERVEPAAVTPDVVAAATLVVVTDEPSLLAVARCRPEAPVVPVVTGLERYGIDDADVDAAVATVEAAADAVGRDTLPTADHSLLDVAVGGDHAGTAVADVTLLTAAPARISEFGVATADGWTTSVRADGAVVATPLGSAGYACDAGGPTLAPATGVVAVPISAYAMNVRPWVLRPPVTLSVEREEAAVTLRIDDEVVRPVPPGTPVEIAAGGSVPLAAPRRIR